MLIVIFLQQFWFFGKFFRVYKIIINFGRWFLLVKWSIVNVFYDVDLNSGVSSKTALPCRVCWPVSSHLHQLTSTLELSNSWLLCQVELSYRPCFNPLYEHTVIYIISKRLVPATWISVQNCWKYSKACFELIFDNTIALHCVQFNACVNHVW